MSDPGFLYVDGLLVDDVETIAREGAATRIHVIDGVQVWLDTERGECDGLCIGVGDDRAEAIRDAIAELRDRLSDLERALKSERTPEEV